MERPLERPHPVFQEHYEAFLFNDRWRIVECQQIREGIAVALRLDSVFKRPTNFYNILFPTDQEEFELLDCGVQEPYLHPDFC